MPHESDLPKNLKPMTALVYAPSFPMRTALNQALRTRGHTVRDVSGAEAAWEAYKDHRPDLVFLACTGSEAHTLLNRICACETAEEAIVIGLIANEEEYNANVFAAADDCLLADLSLQQLHTRLAFAERRVEARKIRLEAQSEQSARARQQAVVAELGRKTLSGLSLTQLVREAAEQTTMALEGTYCDILEWVPEDRVFVLRAGHGWGDEIVEHQPVEIGRESHAGFTMDRGEPVVVSNLNVETRFRIPTLLTQHGVVSSLSVSISGELVPYGVLRVHTHTERAFSEDDVHFMQAVANILAEAIKRGRTEEALQRSEARAQAVLETTVDAILTIDERGVVESYNAAAERIFLYEAHEVIGQKVNMLMPEPYRREHDSYMRAYLDTGEPHVIGIGREVIGQRKDGTTFTMDLAVSEVIVQGQRIFTGIIRDTTERIKLEKEILRISEAERRRIGQDLHDGLGQMLTGIGLISRNLAVQLRSENALGAREAQEITELIQQADQQARGLARGLVPVELESYGLVAALQRLVQNAKRLFGINCVFEQEGHPEIHDNIVATHLYSIAQESVSNAFKHGEANSVVIRLTSAADRIHLSIQDDGAGFPEKLPEDRGMGVRIMHYRARIIGALLEIQTPPEGGTLISCFLPRAVADATPHSYPR